MAIGAKALLTAAMGSILAAGAAPAAATPSSIVSLDEGGPPRSYEELWAGYDPRREPLDIEILKQWEEDGVVLRVVRYRIGIFKGQKAMMAGLLWFDQYLQGTFRYPETPQASLELKTGSGVPRFSVAPDPGRPVLSVDVFYTQQGQRQGEPNDRENTIARFWRHTEARRDGKTWTADVPLLSVEKPLWIYANVLYALDSPVVGAGYYYGVYTAKTVNISSKMAIVTPEQLGAAGVKAVLKPSLLIEPFGKNWQKEWFTYDIPATWARKTHKVYDPQYRAPAGAKLSIEVRTEQPNKLAIGLDGSAAEVELRGSGQWQTVALSPGDFRSADETPLAGWEGIKELRLGPSELLRLKQGGKAPAGLPVKPRVLGGQWKGAPPEFRNLKWTADAASIPSSAGNPAIRGRNAVPAGPSPRQATRSENSYLVIVDSRTHADATLRGKLDLYFRHVRELFGCSAEVVEVAPFVPAAPGVNIVSIREIIQRRQRQRPVSGVILLGQIPYMIWRQAAGGNWVNFGPEDFYYADLEGEFQDRETRYGNGNSDILRPSGGAGHALDNQPVPGREHAPDGQYDTYLRGNGEGPAVWVARIYAPTAQAYCDYFDKVNAYYRKILEQLAANPSAVVVPYKDVLYTGHPNYVPSASSDKYRFFKNFTQSLAGSQFFVFGENGGGTVAELFSRYNARAYLFAEVDGHATPYHHHLKDGAYSAAEVRERLTPGRGALVQALWGCHSGDFTGIKNGEVNLTFAYILSPGITQAAYGCSWTSGTEETEQEILKHMAQGDYLGEAFQKMQRRLYSKAYMEKFFAHEAKHVPNHFLPANGTDKERLEVLMTKLLRGYNLVGNPFLKIAYSHRPEAVPAHD